MPQTWSFRIEGSFRDSRPPLDVLYDVERRTGRLLPRDKDRSDILVFRSTSQSVIVIGGTTTVELRLDAAFDRDCLYLLRLDSENPADPAKEGTWEENLRRSMERWTERLAPGGSTAGSSPDRLRYVVEETIALERERANRTPTKEEPAAVTEVQQRILQAMRQGKSYATAHHEGGTNIRFIGSRWVLQDYGESEERQEFTSDQDFLERLRTFYDWESRRDWYPHAPPEIEAWRYIERQLR